MKKTPLSFYLIALSLPFVLLLILEGGLRVVGIGQHQPLFIPVNNHPDYLQPNPDVIQRYFASPKLAPNVAIDTQFFLAQKSDDTLRIVVMGGSTAAGFPYGRFGSPAGILKHRLKGLYPEQNIDVINVAMSSVNSYMLRDFVPEVLAIEPDAIYIYAGHNEYLGVMGVGSSYQGLGSHTLNLTYLSLKEWRLVQLLQWLFVSLVAEEASASLADNTQQRTVMAGIAKNQSIAYDSPTYHAGIAQFTDNLTSVITSFTERNIPVFLSTLASNDQDQAPFNSTYALPEAELTQLNDIALTPKDTFITAQRIYRAHRFHAMANYRFAQSVQAQSNPAQDASALYTTARDLDGLRFRAPEIFNTIIKNVSEQYENVHLVEGKRELVQASITGVIGNDLMLEHLHPNITGYELLANSALSVMVDKGVLSPSAYQTTQSIATSHRQVGAADIIFAQHKINNLTSDYPFMDTPQPVPTLTPQNVAEEIGLARIQKNDYIAQQTQLVNHYQAQQQWLLAANAASTIADGLVFDVRYADGAAQFYRQAGSFDYAHYYARKATELAPSNVNLWLNLAQIQFNKQAFTDAVTSLNTVLTIEPDHPQAPQYLKQIKQLMDNQPTTN